MRFGAVEIERFVQDTVRIKNSAVVYVDPFRVARADKASLVLITHDHHDHLSVEDIRKVAGDDAVIVAPVSAKGKLGGIDAKEIRYVEPGRSMEINGVKIEAVPAYNTSKFRSSGVPFHPPSAGYVGYVVEMGGVRIYHAGDTDFIPEMKKLRGIDVALLPVSGIYVMTAQEAAEAANAIKPKVAVPMHYDAIVGSKADAQYFKEHCACAVEILG